MMDNKKIGILSLALLCLLSGCGEKPESGSTPPPDPTRSVESAQPSSASYVPPTYDDIIALFSDVYSGASISVNKYSTRLEVHIVTDLPSDAKSDDWQGILDRLTSSLANAAPVTEEYGAQNISAQVETAEGTILANGLNGALTYDVFAEKTSEIVINPTTISKVEYDQISVGMTLSQVRNIIGGDGTLDSEYGSSGEVSSIKSYTWLGEKQDSYATVLFDDFEVYSKYEIGLE